MPALAFYYSWYFASEKLLIDCYLSNSEQKVFYDCFDLSLDVIVSYEAFNESELLLFIGKNLAFIF